MPQSKNPITIGAGLTEANRADLEVLIAICHQHDGLQFPISIEVLFTMSDHCLLAYADQQVVGLACVLGDVKSELTGLVHPQHRRQGIGRSLLAASQGFCRQKDTTELLLICFDKISVGKAFAKAVGGLYIKSEYTMELDQAIHTSHPALTDGLQLRQIAREEARAFGSIMAQAFGDPEEDASNWVEKDIQQTGKRFFFILRDGEIIGTIRLNETQPHQIFITAFGVLAPHRRKGYGRQILTQIADRLVEEGYKQILLDVETENHHALALYESCGFQQIRVESYYQIAF